MRTRGRSLRVCALEDKILPPLHPRTQRGTETGARDWMTMETKEKARVVKGRRPKKANETGVRAGEGGCANVQCRGKSSLKNHMCVSTSSLDRARGICYVDIHWKPRSRKMAWKSRWKESRRKRWRRSAWLRSEWSQFFPVAGNWRRMSGDTRHVHTYNNMCVHYVHIHSAVHTVLVC